MRATRIGAAALLYTAALVLTGCTAGAPDGGPRPSPSGPPSSSTPSPEPSTSASPPPEVVTPPAGGGTASAYPWHRNIPSTTFWVGEIFDPSAEDGTQEYSTYDSRWLASYGGCDGIVELGDCLTEPRTAAADYFPTVMTPRENPFYLDVPYDDVNDPTGFARRDEVVPWAGQEPYRSHRGDRGFSYLKNRWVQLVSGGRTCYGQIEDAGPGQYHDAAYVFGGGDVRPANTRYGGAGLDVSPALTGCLAFPELDGDTGRVDWRFVDASEVPPGPWSRIVTTSGVR